MSRFPVSFSLVAGALRAPIVQIAARRSGLRAAAATTSRAFSASPALRDEEHPVPSEDLEPHVKQLADQILGLNIVQLSKLTMYVKKELGLPDMPMGMGMPMMAAPAGGAAAAGGAADEAPKVEEKTHFDIKLEKYDDAAKLKVIKEVRTLTGLGLKEAKELVDNAPGVVKTAVKKEEAESIKAALEKVGAKIALE